MKMKIPLVFLIAPVFWFLMTWLKYRVALRQHNKLLQEGEKIRKFLRDTDPKTPQEKEEALKRFRARREAETQAKMEECKGKTLIDLVEERVKNKGKKPRIGESKYTPDMFEDPVSRLYRNLQNEKANRKSRLKPKSSRLARVHPEALPMIEAGECRKIK